MNNTAHTASYRNIKSSTKVINLYDGKPNSFKKYEKLLREFKHIEAFDEVVTSQAASNEILTVFLELNKRGELEMVLEK